MVEKVNGEPAILTTFLRDATYTSEVNGIASIDQRLVKFSLRPGTEDPGPANWGVPDYIPAGQRTGLLATFNGGFKLDSAGGGFYLNGIYHGSLVNGAASVVYYKNGTIKIGEWGRDFTMNSSIAGVRQNLKLLVDHGKVSADANSDVTTNWGATLGGGYYVWRSGIGITKDGRIVYVYGSALNAQDLGLLLQRAGAVEGMQMDINPAWMKFDYYRAQGESVQTRLPCRCCPRSSRAPTPTTPRPPATSPRSTHGDDQQDGGPWRGYGATGCGARCCPPRLARAVAACRHHDDTAAAVAEEPAGVRGAAGGCLARPPASATRCSPCSPSAARQPRSTSSTTSPTSSGTGGTR